MGLTERHWFEDEDELNERQLERALEDERCAYDRGYKQGQEDFKKQTEQQENAAFRDLIFTLSGETKNTNPIAFMHGNVSFVDLMDKQDTKGFGDWMFNNGFNTALTVVECYVRAMMDKLGVPQ